MKRELVKLANHLDKIGHRDLADTLDGILKAAQETMSNPPVAERPGAMVATGPIEATECDEECIRKAREKYAFTDDADWNAMTAEEQANVIDTYVSVTTGASPAGEVDSSGQSRRTGAGAFPSGDYAHDFTVASEKASERINKMASLISSEFSSGVPFKR